MAVRYAKKGKPLYHQAYGKADNTIIGNNAVWNSRSSACKEVLDATLFRRIAEATSLSEVALIISDACT